MHSASIQTKELNQSSVAKQEVKNNLAGSELQLTQNQFAIQPKLTVGEPDDKFEKEAESMADTVMRMPENNFVQRKCADCENEEKEIQRKPITPFIQTKTENGNQISDHLSSAINTSRGSGQLLDQQTKSFMESRFGNDFSAVTIHTGSDAVQMNRELNAQAFTTGSDIYFNEGKYQPHTDSGKHLLAHELTHVVQQKDISRKSIQRDLAIEPVAPAEKTETLSHKKMISALEHNRRLHKSKPLIGLLRDVLGINKTPEKIDEEFVEAVLRFQAMHGMVQDGRIGQVMAMFLAEELEAESLPEFATMLLKAHKLSIDINVDACKCKEVFEKKISSNEELVKVYYDCGNDSTVKDGPGVSDCVINTFKNKGINVKVMGTTDSSGNIKVKSQGDDPCLKILESTVFAHEWSHKMHRDDLVEQFGEGTIAFNKQWVDKTDWASDEMRAHTINIHYLKWVNSRLNSICDVT